MHCFSNQIFSKQVSRRHLFDFSCKKPSLPAREQEARAKTEGENRLNELPRKSQSRKQVVCGCHGNGAASSS